MKTWVLMTAILAVSVVALAQQEASWTVKHNRRTIFYAREENPQKNRISLVARDFKTKNSFTISYAGGTTVTRNTWIRTIGIFNEADKELYRQDSASINLPDSRLKKMLLENNKVLHIYSWALPKDPKEAARVRIRRVHLCTIVLQ